MAAAPVNSSGDQSPIVEKLREAAVTRKRPDDSPYLSLSFARETALSTAYQISRREVQILALENEITPERYSRNQKGLSCADQIRLLHSGVAVIGLGGLGGAITEILARLGIGRLTLVDGDSFDESNLNRQLLSSVENIGKMKAAVALARVHSVNPAVEVDAVTEFLTEENAGTLLRKADIAADCLDTIRSRFVLENGCRKAGIPMVSAAIGGTSAQVTVIMPDGNGLQRIYGSPESAPARGAEATLGTPPYTALSAAALQCSEIAALATGKSANLVNRLLLADYQDHGMHIIDLR